MKSRSEILKLVQAKIRLRHFAFSTEEAYRVYGYADAAR